MKKVLGIGLAVMLCLALVAPAMAGGRHHHRARGFNMADADVEQATAFAADIEILNLSVTDVDAGMAGSIIGNTGIVGVNQAPGKLNNQGNVVAVSVTKEERAFQKAGASVMQANILDFELEFLALSADIIDSSIMGNGGIVGVNQAAGDLNNQANAVAIAAGLDDVEYGTVAEAELNQMSACALVVDLATARMDAITGSINGNCGIVGVNQSAGNLNNQANIVSISYSR